MEVPEMNDTNTALLHQQLIPICNTINIQASHNWDKEAEVPADHEFAVTIPYAQIKALTNSVLLLAHLLETERDKIKRPVIIEHDGFVGDIIGEYRTREGRTGVVLQQIGTRIVHVYGSQWLESRR
jgi:hypothetical protein